MKYLICATLAFSLHTQLVFSQDRGDIFQVDGSFNARDTAYFKGSKNIKFTLEENDIAKIVDVIPLPSGNKGLKIFVSHGPNKGKSAWIHYNSKDPKFDVYAELQDDNETEEETLKFVETQTAANDAKSIQEYDAYLLEALKKHQKTEAVIEEKKATPLNSDFIDRLAEITKQSPDIRREYTPEEVCGDCLDAELQDSFSGMEFEKCSSANSHVEGDLQKSFNQSLKDHGSKLKTQDMSSIAKCVQGGMKIGYGSAKYFSCDSPRTLIKATPVKQGSSKKPYNPCRSKAMVGSVSSEIYMATECLDLSYKKMMPIFVHESRFFPNVGSGTGASGVGQLTGVCIKEVNRNFDKYINKYASKPGCGYLKDIGKMHEGYQCARMAAPSNPRHNIVFSVIYQKMIRDNKKLSPKISVDKWQKRRNSTLSSQDRTRIEEMLARVAYNSGPTATMSTFDTFAASPSNRNLSIDRFLEKFYKFYERKVRAEGANYNPKIEQETQIMEKNAGVKCS